MRLNIDPITIVFLLIFIIAGGAVSFFVGFSIVETYERIKSIEISVKDLSSQFDERCLN